MKNKILAVLELCRVSNLPTVISNCVAGSLVAEGTLELTLIFVLIGASLVYSGGMVTVSYTHLRAHETLR